MQVRAAGRKVVTADFRAIHHHALEPFSDPDDWIAAHVRVAEKWSGQLPGVGNWKERALRAEAERDAARLSGHTNELRSDARMQWLEDALAETKGSISWRITAPLRRLSRR